MNINKVISNIDPDRTMYQLLDSSVLKAKSTHHGDTEITFATVASNPAEMTNGCGKLGIILWVDREDYKAAVHKVKGAL